MKRILFVDDEPRILEGLQRMLRPYRKQWEMAFANSGDEALAMLAAGAYDVIVSDMRMPGMDGAQLLELVRERYPGMVRLVLSGQFGKDAALRAVPVAHQFLMKPCDAGKLQATIERFCECDSMIADGATRRVVAAIGELPALPSTYAALVHALDEPDTSLDQVGAIVERDVAVAAKVLQLVNSSFFGLSREVATIPMAVGYLGFETLTQLVVTVEVFRTFACGPHMAAFVEEVQRHSRCVAAIAARLPVPRQKAGTLSVAALLHDVGKLIMATRLTGQFELALKASQDRNCPLHTLEEEITGTTHAEVGAYLLALWGLPSPVVTAVSQHHHPVSAAADTAIDIRLALHLADMLENEAAGHLENLLPGALEEFCKDSVEWSESLREWRKIAGEVVQREAL
ncbi:MAG TPA: response regulator [Bryobacteraceae bacterium]|nr:response regulator [Bryobacteraceae bacterium]